MKVTIAQMNPTVGDIEGNFSMLVHGLSVAEKEGADLIVFPELFLVGYPPKDLLERRSFIHQVEKTVARIESLSSEYPGFGIILGAPIMENRGGGERLYNSALLLYRGKRLAVRHKSLLPTYDVFDEARYFDTSEKVQVCSFKNEKLGISICEDAWNDPEFWPGGRGYSFDPVGVLAQNGATFFINISASPFTIGKEETRFRLISAHAKRYGTPFLYVNQVGGNDELIFDGRSLFVDGEGRPVHKFPAFIEYIATVDLQVKGSDAHYKPQDRIESVFEALVLGTRDYLRKSGFSKAIVGLSGGIDSSVTASIASQALGKENVLGIAMPSPFSSPGSIADAKKLVNNLGIPVKTVPISSVYQSYLALLEEHFSGTKPDITEENIQARIRGNILMAFSNKYGYLVLATGNKSEIAVGYCTLYGDMSGGLGVISDVPKTMVYALAEYINRKSKIIPREIIEKAPSAELKPDQTDQDTLPPYELLDEILLYLIEEGYSREDIVKRGFDEETVDWVAKTVARSEYKRNQAAPGLKVTSKAFGVGRRFPIAAKYEL
jgi:NAD+ synthase (glutamine-hydrolysing)